MSEKGKEIGIGIVVGGILWIVAEIISSAIHVWFMNRARKPSSIVCPHCKKGV